MQVLAVLVEAGFLLLDHEADCLQLVLKVGDFELEFVGERVLAEELPDRGQLVLLSAHALLDFLEEEVEVAGRRGPSLAQTALQLEQVGEPGSVDAAFELQLHFCKAVAFGAVELLVDEFREVLDPRVDLLPLLLQAGLGRGDGFEGGRT